MKYDVWDDEKAEINEIRHGVRFEAVYDLDWSTVLESEDIRRDYGEKRFIAYGLINDRLHCLVYTVRDDLVRVISLRKANKREVSRYGQAI